MQARRSLALLIILTLFTFSIDPAGAAGRSASSIPNTILSGKGAPTLKVGINGDFYIDTRSLLIYGPKKNGKWSSPKNLQGPAGAAGANGNDGKSGSDGKNGSDGKSVAGVSTTAGPAGPAGPIGATGPAGPAGPSGAVGATGPAGATGPSGSGTGTPGPQGATGATGPQGATGAAGAAGPAGADGATGATGSVGATGATGAAGPAGVSNVSVVAISNFNLSTVTPYGAADSENFGALEPNSSYWFHIFVQAPATVTGLKLGAEVASTGVAPNFSVSRGDFLKVTSSSSTQTYGFQIMGTIATTAAASTLVVRIFDAGGDSSPGSVTFSGTAFIAKVGSVS
mgnify:CR=1 FL=1|jgi:hypothetical protein